MKPPKVPPARTWQIWAGSGAHPSLVGDGHHLDDGDSCVAQFAELLSSCAPGALPREGADMHFVEHLPLQLHAAPFLITPAERSQIHDC